MCIIFNVKRFLLFIVLFFSILNSFSFIYSQVPLINEKNLNDVMFLYNVATSSNRHQFYDGGNGLDTIRLQLHAGMVSDSKFLADIIRFDYYLQNNFDISSKKGKGSVFNFAVFDLAIRNIEVLEIELID